MLLHGASVRLLHAHCSGHNATPVLSSGRPSLTSISVPGLALHLYPPVSSAAREDSSSIPNTGLEGQQEHTSRAWPRGCQCQWLVIIITIDNDAIQLFKASPLDGPSPGPPSPAVLFSPLYLQRHFSVYLMWQLPNVTLL